MSSGNRRVRLVLPDSAPAIAAKDCSPGTVYRRADGCTGDYYLCVRTEAEVPDASAGGHRFVYLGPDPSTWVPVDMSRVTFYEVGPLTLK